MRRVGLRLAVVRGLGLSLSYVVDLLGLEDRPARAELSNQIPVADRGDGEFLLGSFSWT